MLIIAALGLEDGVPVRMRLSFMSAPVKVGIVVVVVEQLAKVEAVTLLLLVVVISALAEPNVPVASTSICSFAS
jgi:hypothetical protein